VEQHQNGRRLVVGRYLGQALGFDGTRRRVARCVRQQQHLVAMPQAALSPLCRAVIGDEQDVLVVDLHLFQFLHQARRAVNVVARSL
jgi:hypothetical protein